MARNILRALCFAAPRCFEWVGKIGKRHDANVWAEVEKLRNGDPLISGADCRPKPKSCKGWPSATAFGGFGLDKPLAWDFSRCHENNRWVRIAPTGAGRLTHSK